jgi:hypothetical protein
MTWQRRYKVLRDGEVWSVGYPTAKSAQAAARRLNQGCASNGRFTSRAMDPVDHQILDSLEQL